MRRWHLSAIALPALILWQAAYGGDGIDVTTRLEKTAFYVGEPIHQQVIVQYPESVEFILERLRENNLRMDPFEIRRLSHSLRRGKGFRTLTIELELVTYEISAEQRQIPAFDLYLVRKDAPLDELGESRVETLRIPAQPIAFRSTLPGESIKIRDSIETRSFVGRFWTSTLTGLLLLALLVIPMAARLFGRGGTAVEETLRPERSQMRRALADKLRACKWDATEDAAVFSLYRDLALNLREYAGWVADRRGGSLSGRELRGALSGREDEDAVEWISELVQLADRVPYSPNGLEEGRTRLDEVRQKTLGMFVQP